MVVAAALNAAEKICQSCEYLDMARIADGRSRTVLGNYERDFYWVFGVTQTWAVKAMDLSASHQTLDSPHLTAAHRGPCRRPQIQPQIHPAGAAALQKSTELTNAIRGSPSCTFAPNPLLPRQFLATVR